jgi:hypothetical protein
VRKEFEKRFKIFFTQKLEVNILEERKRAFTPNAKILPEKAKKQIFALESKFVVFENLRDWQRGDN